MLLAGSLFFIAHIHWRESGVALFGASPRTLPLAMAVFIAVLACGLLLSSLASAPAGRTGEPASVQSIAAGYQPTVMLISGVVYVVVMSWIGYLAASALFVGWTALLFGNRRPLVIALMMILAPLALQLFFEKFMVIPLPDWRVGG